MIYNFNLGIGWASSGVEYAQAYRAAMLRQINAPARFIFTDMFPYENIEHMTKNIGFEDDEVIWLYSFFTDYKIAPVSFTTEDFEKTFDLPEFTRSVEGKIITYSFPGADRFYRAYLVREGENLVHRAELVSRGLLVRKDYFTYGRIYSEYYAPLDNKAHLYQRRYFNEDGSIAYEEFIDGDAVVYRMKDKILCSKEEFVEEFVRQLQLTSEDIVIIDRTTGTGQAILQNAGPAKVGIVVHADHFSEGSTNDTNILWNNYYEYSFAQTNHITFYVTATDEQNKLMKQQFEKYKGSSPFIYTIPVGSLKKLSYPKTERKKYSLITASRLASEKHVDWLIEAVAKARVKIPELSLDIYGEGGEKERLSNMINHRGLSGCIRMMGQQDLSEVYQNYEAYLSGSTSEGFGLTLMEAVGGGLPIIGFDVRYGNPTFIDHERNGYLIPVNDRMEQKQRVDELANCIVRLFTEADLGAFHEHSYEIANKYLSEEVANRWKDLIAQIK